MSKTPYQNIKDASKIVNELKYELNYSKNKSKDAERINTIIDALKSFDDMLVWKYRTDAVETLIYSLIYEYLMMYKAYDNEIPLHTIIYNIEKDISNGSEHKKNEVISILKHHEMKNKIKDDSVFDENYINFDELLKQLLNNFKTSILWTLRR